MSWRWHSFFNTSNYHCARLTVAVFACDFHLFFKNILIFKISGFYIFFLDFTLSYHVKLSFFFPPQIANNNKKKFMKFEFLKINDKRWFFYKLTWNQKKIQKQNLWNLHILMTVSNLSSKRKGRVWAEVDRHVCLPLQDFNNAH